MVSQRLICEQNQNKVDLSKNILLGLAILATLQHHPKFQKIPKEYVNKVFIDKKLNTIRMAKRMNQRKAKELKKKLS